MAPRARVSHLTKAEELLRNPHDGFQVPLAGYILEDREFELLKRKLSILDATRIPKSSLKLRDPPAREASAAATSAIVHLVRLFIALIMAPPSELIVACRTKFCEIFLEQSHHVMRWIIYLLHNAPATSSPSETTKACCHLIVMITNDIDENPLTEEIACQDCFADALYLLLCQIDPTTDFHYNFPNGGSGEYCSILSALLTCFTTLPVETALALRFSCYKRKKKNEIVTSLVERTEELLSDHSKADLPKIIQDLQGIIIPFRWLVEDGHFRPSSEHGRLMYRFTAAIFAWTERAEAAKIRDITLWTTACEYISMLTKCAVAPMCPHAIQEMLDARVLTSLVRCTKHVQTPIAEDFLRTLVPYLYPSKIFLAVKKSACQRFWDWIIPQPEWGRSPPPLRTAYHIMMRRAIKAYNGKEDERIDICNNLQHASVSKSRLSSSPRTCARCHAVAYCSVACQEADWDRFHSKECPQLQQPYKDQKYTHVWPSLQRRWDMVRFLAAYANEEIRSPEELLKDPQLSKLKYRQAKPDGSFQPLLQFEPNSALEFVDVFCHQEANLVCYSRMALDSLFHPQAWRVEALLPWLPRYQQFIDSVKENPTSMILIEGHFRLNHWNMAVAFATLRYNADAPSGQRYTVVDSAFRSVSRSRGYLV